ncbi:MAG: hypothetical protein SV422_10040 [Pseudomonadota bacterium]|nr:hypothetical protein [Pseudomonadota bacterium]
MKQVLLGIVVMLLLLVGGGLYYVYTNLDGIVERVIEDAGSQAAGSDVRVDSVDVDLLAGSATVRGFTLANPPGYSNDAMLRFAELAVVLDLASLNSGGTNLHIVSITARDPHLLYEARGGSSNLDAMRENLVSGEEPPADTTGPQMQLAIDSIVIDNIGATVRSDLLPQPAAVDLGDVRLQNLQGTPDEIAQQVLRPLLTQLAANAGRVALTLVPEDLRNAGAAIRDAADARLDQAREAVGEAAQGLPGGLGGLLNRNADEEDEAAAADEAAE